MRWGDGLQRGSGISDEQGTPARPSGDGGTEATAVSGVGEAAGEMRRGVVTPVGVVVCVEDVGTGQSEGGGSPVSCANSGGSWLLVWLLRRDLGEAKISK